MPIHPSLQNRVVGSARSYVSISHANNYGAGSSHVVLKNRSPHRAIDVTISIVAGNSPCWGIVRLRPFEERQLGWRTENERSEYSRFAYDYTVLCASFCDEPEGAQSVDLNVRAGGGF